MLAFTSSLHLPSPLGPTPPPRAAHPRNPPARRRVGPYPQPDAPSARDARRGDGAALHRHEPSDGIDEQNPPEPRGTPLTLLSSTQATALLALPAWRERESRTGLPAEERSCAPSSLPTRASCYQVSHAATRLPAQLKTLFFFFQRCARRHYAFEVPLFHLASSRGSAAIASKSLTSCCNLACGYARLQAPAGCDGHAERAVRAERRLESQDRAAKRVCRALALRAASGKCDS